MAKDKPKKGEKGYRAPGSAKKRCIKGYMEAVKFCKPRRTKKKNKK